jgi:hypothetical protein
MLSTQWVEAYQKMLDTFAPAVAAKAPFRITETNSYYFTGVQDASDTHASALWALDYLHWWAAHGAAGLNFFNGDDVHIPDARAGTNGQCWFAAFWSSPAGYHVHPLGYAMKAFDLGCHGAMVPVKVASADGLNMTAYAVLDDDKHLYLTLINKENGEHPRDAGITLFINGYEPVESITLAASDNDLASTDTETLGNGRIADDGGWTGTWTPMAGRTLTLPAGSATIVRFAPH